MARYTVTRSHDSMGGRYTTGPLAFYEGDDLGAAKREVIARGGLLVDRQSGEWWDKDQSDEDDDLWWPIDGSAYANAC